jgi:hypothetical protein
MIRPIPDFSLLPGIVYALDARSRAHAREFANFVIAPESTEPRSRLSAFMSALKPIAPTAVHTWICEDRWTLLGLTQTRSRPGAEAWDLTYLCAMTSPGGHEPAVDPNDVLGQLIARALDAAIMRGVHRFFARIEDDRPELEIFSRLGFQRYARELTYGLPSAAEGLAALREYGSRPLPSYDDAHDDAHGMTREAIRFRMVDPAKLPIRPWHRHDEWGLTRLYDAATPRRVQIAESLTNDEFVATRAGGGRTWRLPLLEPSAVAYVCDRGDRLGGWLRLRYGRGTQPHRLWLMTHPDDPDVGPALVRLGLEALARDPERPVLCQAREYEGPAIDALRAAGFTSGPAHALLVRHLTLRALRRREVPALEPLVVYGVKGFGSAPTRLSKGEKTHYATRDH